MIPYNALFPNDPIAIIGMGCRFPGAPNPQALWRLLCEGGDAITEVPPDRYDIDAFYDPRPATPGKVMSRYGGFLEQVDQFDAAFFGISPREVSRMDPQHRLLLEVAWEAMEDAGLVPAKMTKLQKRDIGVFMGLITGDYWDRQFKHLETLDVYETTGSARSGAAGRLSFAMDFGGTSFAIDAACSSSLVAVDQAVQNLRSGACAIAVVGGVNVILNPDHTIGFSQGKMMAQDGHCKTYDAAADGYVRSEGAGVVILKRLSQAQADGDQIYAIIRGSAANNDGHCESFMAPSTEGQQLGLEKALINAGVDPLSISYVEAHGTGTQAGDPAEIITLGEVLCQGRTKEQALFVGSVKTNIGHTEGAAGVAGLIKVALSLKYGRIVGNLHFHTPNPAIPWERYPAITIPTTLIPWPQLGTPRRAGVCSYGIAGTNVYVIVEEAPQVPQQPQQTDGDAMALAMPHLLPLSAQTPQALQELAQRYVTHLEETAYSEQAWRDICYTASQRRMHHTERLGLVSHSREEAQSILQAFARGDVGPALVQGRKIEGKQHKIAWLFPGQGSQWFGMARDLFAQEAAFRASIEACDQVMRQYVDWSLIEQLHADDVQSRLHEIDVIQPTLFAIEVSLATLWRSWGVEPDAVVGHSMGETAAAYIAGILSLEDAAWIICERSKLLLRTSGRGAMAAVELSLEEARALVETGEYQGQVSVAVSNSPHSTVLSGDPQALTDILVTLDQRSVFGRLVKVDVASHSPQMDPLRADLLARMQRVHPQTGQVPMFSTVRGAYVDGKEMAAPYWVDNLREPVLFLAATQELLGEGFTAFIEMSPHPLLIGAVRQTMEESGKAGLALASMRRGEEGRATMLAALGTLYANGYEVEWPRLFPGGGRHVSLPTYPWQRMRHWNDEMERAQSRVISTWRSDGTLLHPLLGPSTPLAFPANSYVWTTEVDATRYPYLSEHRVHDMPVLPGAAYIELALAAATEVFGAQQFCVEALTLKRVLFFPKEATQVVQVTLTPDAEGEEGVYTLHFSSTPAGQTPPIWTQHAIARVRQVAAPLTPQEAHHTLPEQDPAQWTRTMEAPAFYEGIRARGIQHGPLFQGVTEIWKRNSEVMAHLTVPQDVADDMLGYQIHPALMDTLLQGIIPFLPDGNDDTYVPVAVREVKLYQRPEALETLWSHAILLPKAQSGTIEGDVILLDEQGHVLLEVLGFRLQSLDGDTQGLMRQRLNQLVYTVQWEQEERARQQAEQEAPRQHWLIFSELQQQGGHSTALGQYLAKRLQAQGGTCVLVSPGEAYQRLDAQHYLVSPTDPEGFYRLFDDFYQEYPGAALGIVYLWGMGNWELSADVSPFSSNQDRSCIGVVHLLQALAATKKEHTPRLWLTTNGVHRIEDEDQAYGDGLAQAPLWGLGRVVVYEYQDLHCTLVDLEITPSQQSQEALFTEIYQDQEADEVAFRDGRRYVAHLTHHALADEPEQPQALFREDSTYLITGGLGGVGLRTAQWMVEQGARYLVLLGRRGASEEIQKNTIAAMRAAGAMVCLMQVDVSQATELATALHEIRRKLPPLRGVFHSAVVLDDGTLAQLDRERFLGVMPPKVDGAWNLHRLTLNDPLDYFVLYSSAASLIGSPGQGNYAAANAFLDALAWYRRQQGQPALCINWGRWGEVGQAMKGDRGERLDVRGFASMKPKEGLTALGSLLWQSPPQIGVMSFNLPQWSQFYPNLQRSSLFVQLVAEIEAQEEEAQSGGQVAHLTREMLAEMATEEERYEALAQYLNRQMARVLGHASLSLEKYQPLNRLGIDSLMSVELKNRISADLGIVIPVTTFLKGVLFGELLEQLVEQLASLPVA